MTQYLFSFKDKVKAETFYKVAKNNYHTVGYIGSHDTVLLEVNLDEKTMTKHIKQFKAGDFGIDKVKVIK